MTEIQSIIIANDIPQTRFSCDISACKGACCTLAGGKGAPLLDEECLLLDRLFPFIKSSLPREHLDTISEFGLYEGSPGNRTTMCYNNHACVFVQYDGGIARCSFEKAFHDGIIDWKKPLSCHLFPIRIDRGYQRRIRYEQIPECSPAIDLGSQENIFLFDFLREPLIRAFGSAWYEDFRQYCIQNNPYIAVRENNFSRTSE